MSSLSLSRKRRRCWLTFPCPLFRLPLSLSLCSPGGLLWRDAILWTMQVVRPVLLVALCLCATTPHVPPPHWTTVAITVFSPHPNSLRCRMGMYRNSWRKLTHLLLLLPLRIATIFFHQLFTLWPFLSMAMCHLLAPGPLWTVKTHAGSMLAGSYGVKNELCHTRRALTSSPGTYRSGT